MTNSIRWKLAAVAALIVSPALAGPQTQTGLIGQGTPYQTPYFVCDSGREGPTVVIVGGVHGNEPAGARAAGQIRHWAIRRGKLLFVPRANVPALNAASRSAPGDANESIDLNRCFPRAGQDDSPSYAPAGALWALIRKHRPDWLVDLHEGSGFRAAGSKSVGSSAIYQPTSDETRPAAQAMLAAVNATIDDPNRTFVLLRGAAAGSLVRAASERLGAKAMILEATYKDQPLGLRARQLRLMVHCLLHRLKMTDADVDQVLPLRSAGSSVGSGGEAVRVAVYYGPGVGPLTTILVLEKLATSVGAMAEVIGAGEVRSGWLSQFDAVIFPGGSGSKQAAGLGEEGRKVVRAFLDGGGGYVGICGGAYLASYDYTWSLRILDVEVIDRKHWRRGTGVVKAEMTSAGRSILGGPAGQFDIRYANGPILAPADAADLPDATVLARFRSEVAQNGAPKGVMPNTPAVVCGRFGQGRAVIFSPHPEKMEALQPLVRRAVLWSAGRTKQDPSPKPQSPK